MFAFLCYLVLATAQEQLPEDVCDSGSDCAFQAIQLRANKTDDRVREWCAKDVMASCARSKCPQGKGVCDPWSKKCMCEYGQCEIHGHCKLWEFNGPGTRMCNQDTGFKCGQKAGTGLTGCPHFRGVCSMDGRCMCRGDMCAENGRCQIPPARLKDGFTYQAHTTLSQRQTQAKCKADNDCPSRYAGSMVCEKGMCLCMDGYQWSKEAQMCMQYSIKTQSKPGSQSAPTQSNIGNMDWSKMDLSKMDWSKFDWGSIDWGKMLGAGGAGTAMPGGGVVHVDVHPTINVH